MEKHLLLLSYMDIHEENQTGSTRRSKNTPSPPYKLKMQEVNSEDKVKSHTQLPQPHPVPDTHSIVTQILESSPSAIYFF